MLLARTRLSTPPVGQCRQLQDNEPTPARGTPTAHNQGLLGKDGDRRGLQSEGEGPFAIVLRFSEGGRGDL